MNIHVVNVKRKLNPQQYYAKFKKFNNRKNKIPVRGSQNFRESIKT